MGLRKTIHSEDVRYVLPIHKDVGHEAIVDVSPMRDNTHWLVAKQFFQAHPGCLSARLVQFRRVDASESDALGSIAKRITIDHVDLPPIDCVLCATEWREGLSTE